MVATYSKHLPIHADGNTAMGTNAHQCHCVCVTAFMKSLAPAVPRRQKAVVEVMMRWVLPPRLAEMPQPVAGRDHALPSWAPHDLGGDDQGNRRRARTTKVRVRVPGFKKGSSRGVSARVGPEIADQRNNFIVRGRGALAGAKRGVAPHRFAAFAFTALGGGPYRVRLKEDNRAFLGIRHDRHSSQTTRKS